MKNRNPMKGKGKGHVSSRPDGWWVGQWSNGETINGKRHRVAVYGKTQEETRRKLDALILNHQLTGEGVTASASVSKD